MRRLLCPALVLAAATVGLAAQDAAAANATVNVGNDRRLSPTTVAIAPGDTVTWQWVGPDTDHRVAASPAGQAETWDSGNEDLRSVGSTFVKAFAASGAFTYVCLVHPDDMRGTVRVGLPQAVVTGGPTNPFTGETVTLDASGSTDPGGGITKYEWDLDGDAAFELDTGAVATASRAYPTAGTVTTRVRVTDAGGNTSIATRAIAVRSRAPVASYTATPGSVVRGQTVSFDASASTDPDEPGTIAKYEWDLDGNSSSFEVDTGTTPTTSRSYATLGTVTTRLRVTDDDGNVSVVTRPVTVTNQLPVASFAATNTGMAFAFTAAGSSDPEGTALTYAWDLDGDGLSFETSSGTQPSASRTYTTGGPRTIRLRVTDADGGTAVTTLAIDVPAPPAPPAAPEPPQAPAPAPTGPAPAPVPSPAVAAPSLAIPVPPALSAAAPRAPRLAAAAARRRMRARGGKVAVRVRCDAACTVAAVGRLSAGGRSLKLRRVTRALAGGREVTLVLAVSRRDRARLRRVRRAVATVTVGVPGGVSRRLRIVLR
jgi:plastocyanin/PKD repeat protein